MCACVQVYRLYNLESGTANSIPHAGQVLALRLHGDTLYTGGSHGLVFAYSLATLAASTKVPATSILTGHDGSITALATNETGHLLASGGADATVKLCDPRVSRSVLPAKLTGHSAAISAVSLRDTVAVTSSRATKGELFVWDIRNLVRCFATIATRLRSVRADGVSVYSSGCAKRWPSCRFAPQPGVEWRSTEYVLRRH
jgi:WD40 repeat protein